MTEPDLPAEIKAWILDRDCIEQRLPRSTCKEDREWHAFDGNWLFRNGWEYRIKSIPKPDDVKGFVFRGSGLMPCLPDDADFFIVRDGETGKIKSMRMIGKPDPNKMEALLREFAKHCNRGGFLATELILEALRTD